MPPCKQGYPQKLIFQFLGVFLTVLSQQPSRKCQVGVDDSALTRDSGGTWFETGCRHQFLTIDFLFLTLLFPTHADFKLPPEKHFYFLPPNSGALDMSARQPALQSLAGVSACSVRRRGPKAP